MEKADSDVLNILLQVMEDGILTDGKGRTISFKNTILILTSNLGSSVVDDLDLPRSVYRALQQELPPEFLNRLDDIVVFEALEKSDLRNIAQLVLQEIALRARVERSMDITFTTGLVNHVVDQGTRNAKLFGARPLRRAAQRILEDAISDAVVNQFLGEGDVGEFDVKPEDQSIVITRQRDDQILTLKQGESRGDMLWDQNGPDTAGDKILKQEQRASEPNGEAILSYLAE